MKLNELQYQFSDALLYKNELVSAQIKNKKAFSNNELLQIHRNNFIMGVTESLSATYQHTLALVGEAFFNAVTRQFILQHPPHENNMMTYGVGFSDFLGTLTQLKSLPYVAEMARFEWLLEQTTNKPVQTSLLDIAQLALLKPQQLESITFQVVTQVGLFSSEQNIQHLYQMIINNNVEQSDLNSPCYLALKKQENFSVELISLSNDEFLLLEQIIQGKSLRQIHPIDLHQYLPSLLEKDLLHGFTLNH